mmetsp:Transcript_99944/g.283045  ORF Transcript_99944/g.283045 Transcript_99944/m.283045 type:complete len:217 (+) Transcript_99944:1062-1712(+)
MVVAAQDDVHLRHLVRQQEVVGHPHVRQRDHELSALLLAELPRQAPGAGAEVLVVHVPGLHRRQCHEPLALDEADEADPAALEVHDAAHRAFSQRPAGLLVHDIAHEPGEVCLRAKLHQVVHAIVKVVVPETGGVDADLVQRGDHVLTPRGRGRDGGVEGVAAEEDHGWLLAPGDGLLPQLPHLRHEARDAAHRLLRPRLHIVDVVEVDDGHGLGL